MLVLAVDGMVKFNFSRRRDVLQAARRTSRQPALFTHSPPHGSGMLTPARYAGNSGRAASQTPPDAGRRRISGYVSAWTHIKPLPFLHYPLWKQNLVVQKTFPESIGQALGFPPHRVPGDGADDDGVCQRLGLCGQGESSIRSTGLQSPSFWLMWPPSYRKYTSVTY